MFCLSVCVFVSTRGECHLRLFGLRCTNLRLKKKLDSSKVDPVIFFTSPMFARQIQTPVQKKVTETSNNSQQYLTDKHLNSH